LLTIPCLANDPHKEKQTFAIAKSTFGSLEAPKRDPDYTPPVELGQRLFWDERWSANGKVACAT